MTTENIKSIVVQLKCTYIANRTITITIEFLVSNVFHLITHDHIYISIDHMISIVSSQV